MQLHIFHFQALSPFHFGTRGVGIEESGDYAPSDTLFSALCNMLRLVESTSALQEMLAAFKGGQPPFLLSGAFPYVLLGNTPLRFYPVPVTMRHAAEKSLRSVKWLSENVFDSWLAGTLEAVQYATPEETMSKLLVSVGELEALRAQFPSPDGKLKLWLVDEVPRVAVDRMTSASNIYQAGRLWLQRGGGLWCAVAGLNESGITPEYLNNLFLHVGHNGLGGERSSGHGQFEVLWPPVVRNVPDTAGLSHFITLSHYHPNEVEAGVIGEGAAYELVTRRGWMSSPDGSNLRHKSVRILAAGSVLNALPHIQSYGGLVDVTPEAFRKEGGHDVWRYGYALTVGVKGA